MNHDHETFVKENLWFRGGGLSWNIQSLQKKDLNFCGGAAGATMRFRDTSTHSCVYFSNG